MDCLKKDVNILKIDGIKNQEILTEVYMKLNAVQSLTTYSNNKKTHSRSSLKLPASTLEEINMIENDIDKISILVNSILFLCDYFLFQFVYVFRIKSFAEKLEAWMLNVQLMLPLK